MGRIIVIEDNPVFRDHVCGMLEKAGYKTRTAYDCAGARRLLEELDDGDIICWSGCGKRVSETRLSS